MEADWSEVQRKAMLSAMDTADMLGDEDVQAALEESIKANLRLVGAMKLIGASEVTSYAILASMGYGCVLAEYDEEA